MDAELIDPVCGMTVEPDTPLHAEHAGRVYRFCNPKCKASFEADPEHYLALPPGEARRVAFRHFCESSDCKTDQGD